MNRWAWSVMVVVWAAFGVAIAHDRQALRVAVNDPERYGHDASAPLGKIAELRRHIETAKRETERAAAFYPDLRVARLHLARQQKSIITYEDVGLFSHHTSDFERDSGVVLREISRLKPLGAADEPIRIMHLGLKFTGTFEQSLAFANRVERIRGLVGLTELRMGPSRDQPGNLDVVLSTRGAIFNSTNWTNKQVSIPWFEPSDAPLEEQEAFAARLPRAFPRYALPDRGTRRALFERPKVD